MKDILQHLFQGNRLNREQAKSCLLEIGKGMHSDAEFASFLTVFKMRPIDSLELAGFRDAMLDLSSKVDLSEFNGIDVVGTGGDGKNTFNISTLTCFIIAGTGAYVTKHGNYASSSTSGSSNVLELLGYKFSGKTEQLKADLERANFCFLHAPLFHPAMKHIAPVRKALKVPTFFNILGPMINPSSPKYQLLGVNNKQNFSHYKNIYETLNIKYTIVNSSDGYDEVSLTADTILANNDKEIILSPQDFGMQQLNPEKLYGGDTVKDAAKIFIDILKGNGTKEQNSVVLANSALGLQIIHPNQTLLECVAMAKESLESGNALKKLNALIK